MVSAWVGGGWNAMGMFHRVLDDAGVRMVGVEAAGHGLETGQHAASLAGGRPGVLHGNKTYLLQDKDGQITEAHSISAGLDYPGIGPEHSWLHEIGRVEYVPVTDRKSVVKGKSVSVRVDICGRRIIQKTKKTLQDNKYSEYTE